MNELLDVLRSAVRNIARLPIPVRPGVCCAVAISIVWILVARSRAVWNALCRALALVADAVVGAILLPEYLYTLHRRRVGGVPREVAAVFGDIAERVLDRVAATHQVHARPRGMRSFPAMLVVLVLTVPVVGRVILDHSDNHSRGVAHVAEREWHYWGNVEKWAGVQAPGPGPTSP